VSSTGPAPRHESPAGAISGSGPASFAARYLNVYRLAAYVLILNTIGHTLGALVQTPQFGPESDTVVSMMKAVHLDAGGAVCTWYGFYLGFGSIASVFLLLLAFLAWDLGGKTASERRACAPLAWALFLASAGNAVIVWLLFFPVAQIFATLVAVLLGVGCMRDWKAGRM
jgi:hypothetical protein